MVTYCRIESFFLVSASSKPVNESADLKWGDSVIDFEFGKQTMSSPSRESKVLPQLLTN